MDSPRWYSMLCFEVCSPELARVLADARCSFLDTEGRFALARPELVAGQLDEVKGFASALLAAPGPNGSSTTIDLTAGRVPGSLAALANPIALLHWLVDQPAAIDFHPCVNAYIGSSDPDDILPFLPFHPAPGMGSDRASRLVVARVLGYTPADAPSEVGVLHLGNTAFVLPG